MDAKSKLELINSVVKDYVAAKNDSLVWQSSDSSVSFRAGKMVGVLMAFGLEFEETRTQIKVFYPSSKRVLYVLTK